MSADGTIEELKRLVSSKCGVPVAKVVGTLVVVCQRCVSSDDGL